MFPRTGSPIRRALLAVVLAGVAGGLVTGLSRLGVLEPLELKGFDLLIGTAAPIPLPPEIVVVDFDDDAMATWGYPIPRGKVAEVLRRVSAGGPDLIGLDFLLSEPRSPDQDAAMAEALREAGNVIIARNFGSRDLAPAEPLQVFLDAALDQAYVNVPVDEDGLIRRAFLVVRTTDAAGVSLPVALATNRLGQPLTRRDARSFLIGERVIPLDSSDLGTALIGAWHARPDPAVLPARGVLEPGFDTAAFQGRIVLIGQSNSAAKDLYPTPAFLRRGGGLFPGAEIHADALAALLKGRLVSVLGGEGHWAVMLLAAAAAAGAALFLGSAASAAVALGVVLAVFGLADHLFGRFLWLRFVSVEGAALLAFILGLGFRVWDERRQKEEVDAERQQVMALFARYVSPEVVRQIWETRGASILTGHECEVTILFSDIRNFTGLTAGRPSAEVLRWLNEYFAEMSQVIRANGGFLNKFIGDGLMVVFGAPLSAGLERDACRAAEAALQMLERVEALNADPKPYRPHLRIGVGLHTGLVTAGNVGSPERMEYSVVGETVNLASRFETLTKEYKASVVMSEATHALVSSRFETSYLGEAKVRGLAGTTRIHTVTGRKDRRLGDE
jgi:adenylate cyclase